MGRSNHIRFASELDPSHGSYYKFLPTLPSLKTADLGEMLTKIWAIFLKWGSTTTFSFL